MNYVDEGWTAIVRPDQLLKLPPKFQDIPPLVRQWHRAGENCWGRGGMGGKLLVLWGTLLLSLAGAATSTIFVTTKVLSGQTHFCHIKTCLSRQNICCDKNVC